MRVVDGSRIRGGALVVAAVGLCLLALACDRRKPSATKRAPALQACIDACIENSGDETFCEAMCKDPVAASAFAPASARPNAAPAPRPSPKKP